MTFPGDTSLSAHAPVFISYTRTDNNEGWVTVLIDQLKARYLADGSPEPLNVFFDVDSVREGDDWERSILSHLQRARAFIAILSPQYFASNWCRREWVWWTRHEMHRHCLRDGAAPVYYLTIEGFPSPKTPTEITQWIIDQNLRPDDPSAHDPVAIQRSVERLQPRQPYDLRPFTSNALRQMAQQSLVDRLHRLSEQVRELLARSARAERSPTDLPDYNPAFTGRVDNLLTLRQDLALGAAGITAVVHGLGGIGKTELALAYAHAYAHEYPGGRYLVPCAGAADWRGALSRFAELHGWTFNDDVKKDADRHLKLLISKLHDFVGERGRCLLLCDNVDQMNLLRQGKIAELRIRDDRFHLLFTTRLPQPADIGPTANIHWHPLDSLPLEDAIELLYTIVHACPESERQALAELARELGGFTIAVELAGRYLASNSKDSPSALLSRLLAGTFPELGDEAERTGPDLFRHGEEARLDFILGQTIASLSPEEIRVLEYAAQMAPDAVPLGWARELLAADFHEFDANQGSPADVKWACLVERLSSLRLLLRKKKQSSTSHNPDSEEESPSDPTAVATIHRLVQNLLRIRCGDQAELRRMAVDQKLTVESIFVRKHLHQPEHRWLFPVIESFAESWLDRAKRGEKTLVRDANLVANHACFVLSQIAEWSRAETLLRQAKALLEKHDSRVDIIDLASTLSNLAEMLKFTNRFAEAELLMRQALAIFESRMGENDSGIADILNNLGQLLQDTNRWVEAEALMRRALAIDELNLKNNPLSVARDLNNLAELLRAMNRIGEAEPMMRRALAIDEAHSEDGSLIARDMSNLAQLLQATSRTTEAEPLMRRVVEILEECLGERHPNVATSLNNLSDLLRASKREIEAEPLIRRALSIDEAAWGNHHSNVARDLNNLALLLMATKRFMEAEPLIRRALAIDEALFGGDHFEVATRMSNLAFLLQNTNRLAEAEPLIRRALAIRMVSFGKDHPDVALTANNLASLLCDGQRFEEAEPLIRRSLTIVAEFTKQTSHEHPHLRLYMNNYVSVLKKSGMPEDRAWKQMVSALHECGLDFRSETEEK